MCVHTYVRTYIRICIDVYVNRCVCKYILDVVSGARFKLGPGTRRSMAGSGLDELPDSGVRAYQFALEVQARLQFGSSGAFIRSQCRS